MVHGIDGELLAEYLWNGTTATIQKEYGYRNGDLLVVAEGEGTVTWLVKDHLGTPRLNVARSGAIGKRHDYLPFGEENLAGSVRSAANGYGADSVRQRFTGYERDSETGLDFAQARYYANAQGRFTSVDPLMASAKPLNPQSWNRYSYCLNNPLVFVDPMGMIWGYASSGGLRQYKWFDTEDDLKAAGYQAYNSNYAINGDGTGYYLSPIGPSYLQFNSSQFSSEMWASLANTQATGGNFSGDQLGALGQAVFNVIYNSPEMALNRAVAGMSGGLAGGLAEGVSGVINNLCSLLFGGKINNPIPATLARIVPGEINPATLGASSAADVFVTAASDIQGLTAAQIATKLTIPLSESGTFRIIEFPTSSIINIASPVLRTNPGFVGRGLTAGGAREFVIPNGPIPAQAVSRVVGN